MSDEREESKLPDTGSSPSVGMSKFDAILFREDEGPASSLLMEGGSDMNVQVSKDSKATRDLETSMVFTPPTKNALLAISTEEMKYRSFVHDKLREQLEKAQSDLASERTNRKRKEKSLIKLAKELTKRSEERESKEKALLDLSETIEDLECRLGSRNRELVVELPKLKAQCAQQKTDLANYERDSIQLRARLEEARLEADKAKGKLINHLSTRLSFSDVSFSESDDVFSPVQSPVREVPYKVTNEPSSMYHLVTIAIAVLFCMALSFRMVLQNEVISMDTLCAPVPPGSKFFRSEEGTFDAPWWAPHVVKEPAFSVLCGSRDRMRFQVKGGVVDVSRIESGQSLWKGRALGGLSVDSDSITVRNWWGSPQQVSAPWSE